MRCLISAEEAEARMRISRKNLESCTLLLPTAAVGFISTGGQGHASVLTGLGQAGWAGFGAQAYKLLEKGSWSPLRDQSLPGPVRLPSLF